MVRKPQSKKIHFNRKQIVIVIYIVTQLHSDSYS